MKPHFEQIFYLNAQSISAEAYSSPYFSAPWHFHSEYELVYIVESYGKQYVGDSIEEFDSGCLVLLGPNLPHVWLNDKDFYLSSNEKGAKCVVVHFDRYYFPKETLNLPEFKYIRDALERAVFGIKIIGKELKQLAILIGKMPVLHDISRYNCLLSMLEIIGKSNSAHSLVGKGYVKTLNLKAPERLQRVIDFVNANYKRKVNIEEVAEVASMNRTSFCRYFKEKTGKTFTEYVNEIRISYACKLLIDGKYNISQICYESGYNNLSNFNRQFMKIIQKTPLEYRDAWGIHYS